MDEYKVEFKGPGLDYYDKDGKPMTMEEWGDKHSNFEYKLVARDDLGYATVSTVWLGLDHGFTPGAPPVIFETMIFTEDEDSDYSDWQDRYCTEAEALKGHERALKLVMPLITHDHQD